MAHYIAVMTALRPEKLLCPKPEGLYCAPGDFYIDPALSSTLVLEHGELRHIRYWTIDPTRKLDLSYSDAVDALREKLDAAVASRLVADVPLGIFLSGGLDSSTVAAIASRPLRRRSSAVVSTAAMLSLGWPDSPVLV